MMDTDKLTFGILILILCLVSNLVSYGIAAFIGDTAALPVRRETRFCL